jgi:hypothetical protein
MIHWRATDRTLIRPQLLVWFITNYHLCIFKVLALVKSEKISTFYFCLLVMVLFIYYFNKWINNRWNLRGCRRLMWVGCPHCQGYLRPKWINNKNLTLNFIIICNKILIISIRFVLFLSFYNKSTKIIFKEAVIIIVNLIKFFTCSIYILTFDFFTSLSEKI